MGRPRLVIVASLVVLLILLTVRNDLALVRHPHLGVDIEIPLRAADRWLAGRQPYQAQAFINGSGATLPFLYPPVVLPLFAPLSWLPRTPVLWGAVAVMLVAAVAAARRLLIPWVWIPLVLLWRPFFEGIVHTNLTILTFLAFAILFYQRIGSPWRADPRDVSRPDESVVEIGALATVIGSVKVSQPHAWLFVLHYRWRAAAIGAIAVGALVALALTLTGTQLWFDWIDQLRRAGNPAWTSGGFAMPRYLPPLVAFGVALACAVAVWFVPRQDGGPWVGVLSTAGAVSLHQFGLLFLIPAMLRIRLEIALVAACLIATHTTRGSWAGIILITAAYAASAFAPVRFRAWLRDWPTLSPSSG
jgi:Glycosyltransferase family 87